MLGGVYLRPDLGDLALAVDQEGRADDAEKALSGKALGLPGAVEFGDLVLAIGEEREGKEVLGLEALVRGDAVGADAEHDRAAALELALGVTDTAGFLRASGRVVLGIEVEYDRLASVVR